MTLGMTAWYLVIYFGGMAIAFALIAAIFASGVWFLWALFRRIVLRK